MEVISRVENKKLSEYAQQSILMAMERFEGKEVVVTIKEFNGKRSLAQNRTMHNFYGPISDCTGHTEEELHEIFKASFIGYDVFTYNGEKYIKSKTSTRLTKKGMAKMLEKIIFVANWLEIKIPIPNEGDYGR